MTSRNPTRSVSNEVDKRLKLQHVLNTGREKTCLSRAKRNFLRKASQESLIEKEQNFLRFQGAALISRDALQQGSLIFKVTE